MRGKSVRFPRLDLLATPIDETQRAGVSMDYALRVAGRAGRIKDVSEVIDRVAPTTSGSRPVQRKQPEIFVQFSEFRYRIDAADDLRRESIGQSTCGCLVANNRADLAVGEHERTAGSRGRVVDRDIAGAGLHGGKQAGYRGDGFWQADANSVTV